MDWNPNPNIAIIHVPLFIYMITVPCIYKPCAVPLFLALLFLLQYNIYAGYRTVRYLPFYNCVYGTIMFAGISSQRAGEISDAARLPSATIDHGLDLFQR